MVLKELIKSKGFKQKYIAEKIGVSEVTLSNWVKGKALPTEENIKKLSQILDVPAEYLRNQ